MEVLISEIQKRHVLWNKWNPRYKDRLVVDKEWDLVARNTGFTKDEAKKKWRNLRDQFSKELKKIPIGKSGDSQNSAAKYRGKWQYFTALLFLKDTLMPRDTEGNVSETDTQESGVDDTVTVDEESDDDEESRSGTPINLQNTTDRSRSAATETETETETETLSALSSASFRSSNRQLLETETSATSSKVPSSRPSKRRGKEQDSTESQFLQIEAKKLALLEKPEDDDFMFFKSLLPYFKQMHPIQKLRIRSKFQNLLIEEMTNPFNAANLPTSNNNPSRILSVLPNYSHNGSPASSTSTVYSQTNSSPATPSGTSYSYIHSPTSNILSQSAQLQYTGDNKEKSMQTYFTL